MTIFESGSNYDPFVITGQDTSSMRKQIAQYAIAQAATYMQNSQNEQAIAALKKAISIDAQNVTAYNYLGKLYLSQGKNAEAIKAYQQLVRIQSNPYLSDSSSNAPTQVEAYTSLGNAYAQDKQYTSAEKAFKTAASLDPQDPLATYTLGLMYANTDRLSEAETQLLKVKKISPNDGNVYYALGMVYNKQGRSDEAVANLEKALTLKKTLTAANYELGVAYDALDRTEDAQRQLSILQSSSDTINALNLKNVLNKPSMIYMDTKNSGGFSDYLGPGVPLWMLDPTQLTKPSSSKTFSVTIGFNTDMDAASITNTQNWSISRADGNEGGYYNNTMPLTSKDVSLPGNPIAVYYNSLTKEATLMFSLAQNSSGDAVIDQKHIVFKFSGKDALGRIMDTSDDEIDGNSITSF